MKFLEIQKFNRKSSFQPSVSVPRAETRLTVHRSPLVRMLCQLVDFGSVERLIRKFTKKCMLLIGPIMHGSYRRYVCRSNKDAESASWPRSGRATIHKI